MYELSLILYPTLFCLVTDINSLRPRPNRRHFADVIFKCIFEIENEWISPRISLKFVPKVRINNIPTFVHIMAWRRPGDKPLSEPMMVSLLTHICVTRPQWVNQNIQRLRLYIPAELSMESPPAYRMPLFAIQGCSFNEMLFVSTSTTIQIW